MVQLVVQTKSPVISGECFTVSTRHDLRLSARTSAKPELYPRTDTVTRRRRPIAPLFSADLTPRCGEGVMLSPLFGTSRVTFVLPRASDDLGLLRYHGDWDPWSPTLGGHCERAYCI